MTRKAAITVLGDREEVERRWRSSGERPDSATFSDAPGDRGTEIHVETRQAVDAREGQGGAAALQAAGRDRRDPALRRRARGRARRAPAQAAARAAADRLRAGEGGWHEGERVVGPQHGPGRERAGPEDPQRPRRDREDHLDGDLRLGPAPLRRLRADDEEGRHPRPRVHGRGRRDRPRRREPQGGRPRRRAVPDRVRELLGVPARALLGVRELEPERRAGGEDVRPRDGGDLRLLAPDRRLRRRAGGVRARAVRRRRADQDRGRPDRRAGAVPVGHLPDRLHGRGVLRDHRRRGDRGVRRRARSASSRSPAPCCSAPSG